MCFWNYLGWKAHTSFISLDFKAGMESLKRRLSFRKKKNHVPECSKPHQWQEDEKKVRDGTCSFQVRYLGCVEVFESRGMQVCEEAVKTLKSQCKGKYQRAVLYVSGDALRVVDEISKSMIVDQTIEKVSFCAPDRNHEKGFAYICRDGTTRRWMCHGFLAVKESVSVSIIYYDFSLSRRTAAEMCLMSQLLSKQPVLYITSKRWYTSKWQ